VSDFLLIAVLVAFFALAVGLVQLLGRMLGRPRDVAFSPGRLLFLRALAADDPVTGLWSLSLETAEERLLADPRELLAGAPEEIPAAELRRRERLRETARGIVAYSLGAGGQLAAFALSGRLFVCDVAAAAAREIAGAAPCVDPQLSPDGTAVAYLAVRCGSRDWTGRSSASWPTTTRR
jgi:dipeptidyl-peptidase 4